MSVLVILILVVIVFILAVICVHKGAQVTSLKNQVDFLEYSLRQITEKESKGNEKE